MAKKPIVAIDGPAGSGKSTVAKQLAHRLGFTHIDTGALYRGVAWLSLRDNIALDDEAAVVARAGRSRFSFKQTANGNELHLDDANIGSELRTEVVSQGASRVSAFPSVREFLLGLQQSLGRDGAVVLEGRDIGTVVFPNAEVKFYLTASVDERAHRRMQELAGRGEQADLAQVKQAIIERDANDMNRAIAPLKKAADAHVVDTTGLTIEQVLDKMQKIVRENA